MKYKISGIDTSIRENIEKIRDRLRLEIDAEGVPIKVTKGEKAVLDVKPHEVNITYTRVYEVFYALKQLVSIDKKSYTHNISCTFEKLGVMMDCSRNAVPSVEFLKDFILNLALMGYNELQLYTEDTYEVEGEPYFGYMRGKYSAAEIREIVAFAEGFDIEIVPCIQTLAHLNQLFRWNQYKEINDIDDILLIDDEKTYALIDKMFASISKTFKSKRIHIGMDEAHMVGRGKYLTKNGNVDKTKLMLKHLNKVVEIAKKYGYTPMMWSDMFFRIVNGGKYFVEDGSKVEITPETIAAVPNGLQLVYWDYYRNTKKEYDKMFKYHAKFTKNETVFAGGAWRWTGFVPKNEISCARTKEAFAAAKENGVKKVMLTMWGDDGSECGWNSVLPSLCCAADIAYGDDRYASSFAALTGISVKDFMAIDLPDTVVSGNVSKVALYNDYFLGLYDEVLKPEDGAKYKDIAAKLRKTEKIAGRYAYLFKTLACLSDVLAIKYTLGKQTREAYNRVKTSENVAEIKKKLKKLVSKSYKPLVSKLKKFYEALRVQWYKENKPFGFEVQDARLGGLILRTEHCIYELERYIKGEINSIPELEERQLAPDDCSVDRVDVNSYLKTFSAGKM